MKDFIEIPNYIEDIHSIKSSNLNLLFENVEIQEAKLSINFLRDLYKKNKSLFIDIRDELILRGFIFNFEKPNNLLPKIKYSDDLNLIYADSKTTNFKAIHFSEYGLSQLIKRFNINDDRFFHLVPIENFSLLNRSIDIELLKKEMISNHFQFITKNRDNMMEENNENFAVNYNKTYTSSYNDFIIADIFNEDYYKSFVNFCDKNKINTFRELSNKDVQEYQKLKEVEPEIFQKILRELRALSKKDDGKVDSYTEEYIIKCDKILVHDLPVKEIFKENKFNIFVEYCNNNKIGDIKQVTRFNIDEFSKENQVGKKKVIDVLDRFSEMQDHIDLTVDYKFRSGLIFNDIKDYTLSEINDILNLNISVYLDYKISELENYDLRKIENDDEKKQLLKINNKLQRILPISKIIEQCFLILNEKEKTVINYRYLESFTLEDIGKKVGLTRERVRQIQKKSVNKIISRLKNLNIIKAIKLYLGNDSYYSEPDLLKILSNNILILELIKETDDLLFYLKKYDLFFLSKKERDLYQEEIKTLTDELPEVIFVDEIATLLSSSILDSGNFSADDLLTINGYKRYGKCYTTRIINNTTISDLILKYDLTGSFKLNDDNFNKLRKISKEKYNFEFSTNIYTLEGILRRLEDVILVDKGTYQKVEFQSNISPVIDSSKKYMESILKDRNSINIREVYDKYKQDLSDININSKHHLYSILKYLYNDSYDFGKGNTLNIYNNDTQKLTEEERLYDFIAKRGGIASKKQITNILKWPIYKIDLTSSSSKRIVLWGNHKYRIMNGWITDEHKQILEKNLTENLDKGFVTAGKLYLEARFDPVLSKFLNKEKVDTEDKLLSIIKNLFGEYAGTSKFITNKHSQYKSIESFLVDKYKNGVTRKELYNFLSSLHYKDITINNIINKLTKESMFIEVDQAVYIPAKYFEFKPEITTALLAFAGNELSNKKYLALKSLEGYKKSLPEIQFNWNPHLIKSILVNNGYRHLTGVYNDYRYDQLILVPISSNFYKIDELVHYLLTFNYKGNLSEKEVLNYLLDIQLIKQPKNLKLPRFITDTSDLVEVDSIGLVKLKETHIWD